MLGDLPAKLAKLIITLIEITLRVYFQKTKLLVRLHLIIFQTVASVFLALAAYRGTAGTSIVIEHKIIGNALNLEITHKTDLIAAAVMNQPFYLITASPRCNFNVISKQYLNPNDLE